jgi:hypothetical protein
MEVIGGKTDRCNQAVGLPASLSEASMYMAATKMSGRLANRVSTMPTLAQSWASPAS